MIYTVLSPCLLGWCCYKQIVCITLHYVFVATLDSLSATYHIHKCSVQNFQCAVPIIVINDIKLINNQIFGPMCSSSHQHNYILLFSCSVCQTNLYKSHICIHGMCQSMCEQPQRRQKQRRKFN